MKQRSSRQPSYHWRIATPSEQKDCYCLRAKEYSRYYENIPKEQFTDEFDRPSDGPRRVSYVIAVYEDEQLVGTVRLLITRHPEHPNLPSEVMELMDVNWATVGGLVDCSANELLAGELGKFAVRDCRNKVQAKWTTVTAAGHLAAELGLHTLLVIMPRGVEHVMRRVGIRFQCIENVPLLRNSANRNRFLLKYHDYFLPDISRMRLKIDASRLKDAESQSLEMLAAGSKDGPSLWWITPEKLLKSVCPQS